MKIIKFFFYILFLPLWYLQYLIKRDDKVWVFGEWYGKTYSDNSKYFYEYVLKNSSDIKPYWITKNKKTYNILRSQGKPCLMYNSFKAIHISLIAGIVFISCSKSDINKFFINGAKIIQFWHGSPIKKIGMDSYNYYDFLKNIFIKYFFPFNYEYNYYACFSSGKKFNKIYRSAFGLNDSQVFLTGSPRNDILFSNKKSKYISDLKNKSNLKKIILYLPTFRDSNPQLNYFQNFDSKKWNDYLVHSDSIMIFKNHFAHKLNNLNFFSDRIIYYNNTYNEDLNLVLNSSDVLITDFSGVYFDFLLTKKPIILFPYKYEEYIEKSRKLYFEYFNEFKNSICLNWSEILELLKNNKIKNVDFNYDYNKYRDANNSQRVYNKIYQQIK